MQWGENLLCLRLEEELAVSAPARGGEESGGSSEDREEERSQPGAEKPRQLGQGAQAVPPFSLKLICHCWNINPTFHPDINSTVYTWKQGVGA